MHKKINKIFFTILFLKATLLSAGDVSAIKYLYHSLEPSSLSHALAFLELYPDCAEANILYDRTKKLLNRELSKEETASLASLYNRIQGMQSEFQIDDLQLVESLASHLPNRKLQGYYAQSEEEVIALPSSEIDLGKALLLSQLAGSQGASLQARNYSGILDLMALQILSELKSGSTVEEKIAKTNELIFEKLHFRFPPQSIYAEQIDLYTFLPSVMDNHLGVCLGVTAMYLALAQRIGLELEIITPPGHIYVRYNGCDKIINIETTARGIDMPSETYLNVHTPSLTERSLKEVVGMTHFNQASTYLYSREFEKAAACYEKALPYMSEDALLKELLAFAYLFTGEEEKGKHLLKEAIETGIAEGSQIHHQMAEDYFAKKVDLEGIQVVFMRVDQSRESILEKIDCLEKVLEKFPDFRDGLEQLATSWIQLNRTKEGMSVLKRYHEIDSDNPVIEYYLAVLHGQRHDFKNCWQFFKNASLLCQKKGYFPKVLQELQRQLMLLSPCIES